jgi:hypothetical protein
LRSSDLSESYSQEQRNQRLVNVFPDQFSEGILWPHVGLSACRGLLGTSFGAYAARGLGTAKFSDEGFLQRFTGNVNASGGAGGPIIVKGDTAKGGGVGVIMKFKVTRGALFTAAPAPAP